MKGWKVKELSLRLGLEFEALMINGVKQL